MRTLSLLFFSATAAAVFASAAGCGGKVVIEQGAGGAGQGGSSNATSTTNVTVTNGTSTVTSGVTGGGGAGGDAQTNCTILCDVAAQQGCMDDNCLFSCIDAASGGPCAGEFAAWIDCAAKHADEITDCLMPKACGQLQAAYEQCLTQPECGPQECAAGDDGSCSCAASCNGTKFEASCQPAGNGKSVCVCSIDGTPVDKCMNSSNSCDVSASCCGEIFFGGG